MRLTCLQKTRVYAWFAMMRPLQLLAVMTVTMTGMLIARRSGYVTDPTHLLWHLIALLPVAVSIHYVNEYTDVATDSLTVRTPFSGGSGILPRGVVAPPLVLSVAWLYLAGGVLYAGIGVLIAQMPVSSLVILLIGGWGGWMYSLPPVRLVGRGAGEVTNALLGGMLLLLYGYSSVAGQVDPEIVLTAIPFTLFVFLNLLATTWADREADGRTGKNTLAVRLSVHQLRRLYSVVLLLAAGSTGLIYDIQHVLWLSPAFIYGIWAAYRYTRQRSPFPSVSSMTCFMICHLMIWL